VSGATFSGTESEGAVSLHKADDAPRGEELRGTWACEDTVPLHDAAGRVEAEERAERMRLVTGRHARPRPR
jgi:hypothetical protein